MHSGASQDFPVGTIAGAQALPPPLTEADAALGVVARWRQVVTAAPRHIAVADQDERLTADDLARLAASVRAAVGVAAGGLAADGAVGGVAADGAAGGAGPVAVLHEHRVGAVGAILGVLASGHPLLVLHPRTPQVRLRALVRAAGVRAIVCGEQTHDLAASVAQDLVVAAAGGEVPIATIVLGRDTPEVPVESLWTDAPPPDAPALLLPCPGADSAGPRLAVFDHRTALLEAYGRAVVADGVRPGEAVLQAVPLASADGVWTVLAASLAGGRILLDDARTLGIDGFADRVQAQGPSVLCLDAPLVRDMLRTWPWSEQFAALRTVVICGGESIFPREREPLLELLPPACTLRRWYGTDEGGLLAEYVLRHGDAVPAGALPAGRAAYDRELVLVDDQERPVPAGQVGRITVVARAHLFSGYLRGDSGERSITPGPDGSRRYRTGDVGRIDADGILQVIGRVGESVRLGSQTVYPGEIDAALFARPEVREAVVVADAPDPDRPGRLVAYVVPDADQPSAARLRSALRAVLPIHLVPEAVIYLEALPRTEFAAIDRSALPPAPPRVFAALDDVRVTSMEMLVAAIWADVLELDRVGSTEDFFELGGDSLSAEALVSRVITDLGVSDEVCTTSLLIEAPTVAEFAARLRSRPSVRRGPLVPLHRAGVRPPLFLMAGGGGLGIAFVPWARLLGPDQPTWALQCSALEARGLPERSVPSIARSNIAAIRSVQPHGPYYLAGYSFGGLVALEMAHRLTAAGEQVGLLAVIDSYPPDRASQPRPPQRTPVQKARDLAGVALMSALSTPGGRDHWRFQLHAGRLARRYTAAPWSGRALVMVADSQDKQLRSRWAPHLTGPWRMVEIPGDHLSITRLPWASVVARELRAELDAAQGLVSPDRDCGAVAADRDPDHAEL